MMKVWIPGQAEISATESWGIWSKEVSEFPWFYSDRETCYILEGEAEAFDKKGNHIKFKAGDMVMFEEGLECTWKITRAIRKRYKFG
ncbi:MAG: cupin domain-containing protein [Bacteroidales bacterium]|nr:cupin domain-containing protein [Bacteroidales bacterium]